MPPVITQTQDNWTIRTIDVTHINPSILEGQHVIHGILPKRAAIPLLRYPPVNLVPPSISGDFKIPAVLTCNPGVWDAAPTADYLYQWRANGVQILGETGPTWTSNLTYDAFEIDCVVTAVNNQGFATLPTSNQITVEIVEPIEVREQDYYSIQGLNQFQKQNMMIFREAIITGISTDDQVTMFENKSMVVSGMGVESTLTNADLKSFVVTGLAADDRVDSTHMDLYVLQIPEFLEAVPVLNFGAEDGMNHWTQTEVSNVLSRSDISAFQNTSVFMGGNNTVFSGMEQTIALPVSVHPVVDASQCLPILSWFQGSFDSDDRVKAYMIFLDVNGDVIDTVWTSDTYVPSWTFRSIANTTCPVGTRSIKIRFEFSRVAGANNDGYVDQIVLEMWEQVGAGVPVAAPTYTDPYYDKVTLLMNFETGFDNEALFGHDPYTYSGTPTLDPVGLVAGSNSRAKFNVDATNENDRIGLYYPGAAGMNFGTGDFTIEGFAETTSSSSTYWHSIIGNYDSGFNGSWAIMRRDNNDGGVLIFLCDGNASVQGTTNVNSGVFHFAISRNGDTLRLFVNGVMEGKITGYVGVNVGGTPVGRLGGNNQSSNDNWRGYIDSVRVTKGVGRYDHDTPLTVPTAPYAL